jgi:catechol 2,3-dioxygenase
VADQKHVQPSPIDPGVTIGHVHLKVSDLDRALGFYQGVLGFGLVQRYGRQAAFLAAGGYHHHIGLNTWQSRDGASDHGVSEALYLRDPDQNGVELYWDRPPDAWPRTSDGRIAMDTGPLDLDDLARAGFA